MEMIVESVKVKIDQCKLSNQTTEIKESGEKLEQNLKDLWTTLKGLTFVSQESQKENIQKKYLKKSELTTFQIWRKGHKFTDQEMQ